MTMSVDALVSSLQPLAFGAPPPYTAAEFAALAGDVELPHAWHDLETQIRNVIAEERARLNAARGKGETEAARWQRPAAGCDLYWQNRARAAMAEKDTLRRDEAIDRLFWDAAGELTPVASPLSHGALETYAIRLAIAQKRAALSTEAGNAAFTRLVSKTALPEI